MKGLPLGRYPVWLGLLGVAAATVAIAQAWTLSGALLGGAVLPAFGVIVARALLHRVRTAVAAHAAARVTHEVRLRALASSGSPGHVATVVTRGVDALVPYLTAFLPQVAACAVVPLAVLVAVAVTDPLSALTMGITLPLVPLFAVLVGKHTKASTRAAWAGLTRLGGHFADVVRGLDTLTVYGRAKRQEETVRDLATAHAKATMRTLRVAFLSALVLELVATLSVALVAVPVGLRLLAGSLPAHPAVFVLLLTPEAYLPLRAAGAAFHASAEGRAAIPAPPRPVTTATARPPDLRHAPIELRDVTVQRGTATALHAVNLTVEPGRHYAVTGPNGAGKSTLLAVLLGLLPPTAGQVLVGGVDLRELDHAAWCAGLSWIPQRPWLTTGTLAENVALGHPATPAALQAACAAAHLPLSLDRPVTRMSAGERQRVALARALLRTEAPLLLLDEPTERLDNTTETAVTSTLEPLLRNRTAVVVAHRPLVHQALHDPVRVRLAHGHLPTAALT